MWERFLSWSIPDRLVAMGPDTVRRARLLLAIVLLGMALGLVGSSLLLAVDRSFSPRLAIILGTTALAAVVPLELRRTASLVWAGNLGALIAFASIGFLCFLTGGLGRPLLGLQALIPLMAVLVAGVRWGALWAVLGCVEAWVLLELHRRGFVFPNPAPTELQDEVNFALGTMLFLMTLLIGAIYESLKNTALVRLQAANRQLQIARDTAEAATRTAEEAMRARSSFLATMSHEIRTPMNALIGMSGLLEGTTLSDEQRDFVETIRHSGESLLTLLNDILDFSKIESGKLEVEDVPFDVRATIEEAIDVLVLKTEGTGVELLYEAAPDVPRCVSGDPTRVRQILINLLSNAVKFTEAGEIHVSVDVRQADRDGSALHFAVRDTGIGIPADRLDRLFESFTQVDASTTRKYGGTGLGLAISNRLAELMGGGMWVESEEGRGSTFHFTIRTRPVADAPAATHEAQVAALAGRDVLVVDDNETSRGILAQTLERWGMRPTLRASGAEALETLRGPAACDVAIVDLEMPGMDGAVLARAIRALPARAGLPIVLLSPPGARLEEAGGGGSGARVAATLSKPARPAALATALAAVFGETTRTERRLPDLPSDLGTRHPLRILLAEDNRVNQKVARKILERLGYQAAVVENGVRAVEMACAETFDVILMDIQMPEMDGMEATRLLHERLPSGRRPRVIALTANAFEEERQACLAAGMDAFLSKPLSVPALIETLRQCAPLRQGLGRDAAPAPEAAPP